MCLGTTSKHII